MTSLKYTVSFVESESPFHEAQNLLCPGPSNAGWRTAAGCSYPQELLLATNTCSLITGLKLMFPRQMVSTGIEIFVGKIGKNAKRNHWRQATFVAVGNVAISEDMFKGNVLISVQLDYDQNNEYYDDFKTNYVKIVFRKNHINKENESNQVGLLGLQLIGQPQKPDGAEEIDVELPLLVYGDNRLVECVSKLRSISKSSEHARALRTLTTELESEALMLGAMQMQEDFDIREIDLQRQQILQNWQMEKLLRGQMPLEVLTLLQVRPKPPLRQRIRPKEAFVEADNDLPDVVPRGARRRMSYEERDLQLCPGTATSPRPGRRSSLSTNSSESVSTRSTDPENFVYELTLRDRQELQCAIEIFGANLIQQALNKHPGTKQRAMKNIHTELRRLAVSHRVDVDPRPSRILRASSQIICRLLRDKLYAIFNLAIEMLETLTKSFLDHHPRLAIKDLAFENVTRELIKRGGDSNERVHVKASNAIQQLLMDNERIRRVGGVQQVLTEPLEPTRENGRQALTRAQLVLQMHKTSPKSGLPARSLPKALVHFAISAVEHVAPAVRRIGEQLLISIYSSLNDVQREELRSIVESEMVSLTSINWRNVLEAFHFVDHDQLDQIQKY